MIAASTRRAAGTSRSTAVNVFSPPADLTRAMTRRSPATRHANDRFMAHAVRLVTLRLVTLRRADPLIGYERADALRGEGNIELVVDC